FVTLDLIKNQPKLAKFQFRTNNRWIDESHNHSTIKNFYATNSKNTTHNQEFIINTGKPTILLNNDTSPNPVEHLLHALATCLTTTIIYITTTHKIELTSVESTLTNNMDVRSALNIDDDPHNEFEH